MSHNRAIFIYCVDNVTINVELVQKCISQLKKVNAPGGDGFSVEHITLVVVVVVVVVVVEHTD